MKMRSRLTALVLAVLMLISTAAPALATTALTLSDYQGMVDSAASSQVTAVESDPVQTSATLTTTSELVERTAASAVLTAAAETESLAEQSVVLPIAGSLTLDAAVSGAANYQWQVNVGGVWANIVGDVQSSITLTYPMLSNALVDGSAKVRCRMTVGEEVWLSAVANVTVDETINTTTVTTEQKVAVETYAAAQSTTAAETRMASVSTFNAARNASYETYDITVNYLYEDSSVVAADPHIAQVGSTSTTEGYNATVTLPAITGYQIVEPDNLPTGVTYADGVLNFDIDVVTADMTINIYYEPALVNYTVRYFKQNVNDDNYIEVTADAQEYQGYTGATIKDSYPDGVTTFSPDDKYTGFKPLIYDEGTTIAADGSTVINVYYDRLYYLMIFDLQGGTGVEPIFARFGTEVSVPNPTRLGYTFAGWDKDIPAKVPAENTNYTASWTPAETTFSVVYWLEDPNSDSYNYWASETHSATTETVVNGDTYKDYGSLVDPVENEYEIRYSEYNSEKTDKNVEIAGDGSTVVNVYYDREEFTLKFYYAMLANNKYYVVGGSTYYFGAAPTLKEYGVNTEDALDLMEQYFTYSAAAEQLGEVKNKPELNANGLARNYASGSDTRGNRQYLYISFTAKYGADISNLWPCDVFNSVTALEPSWGVADTAWVSTWNGEHHVYYSQHHLENETIKGNYNELDYQLLWDDSFGASADSNNIVDYLCFWENGADVNWSIPELYAYHIFVPLLDGQDETGLTIRTYNGTRYYLRNLYNTVDNSIVDQQTAPPINGLTLYATESERLWDFDKTLYAEPYNMYFYYTRNEYKVTFHNVDSETSRTHLFEEDITEYESFVPSNPTAYPAGAYEFGGWYTNPECSDEAKYTFETMPSHDLLLYAKWVPIPRTVTVYLTEENATAGAQPLYTFTVANGSATSTADGYPANGIPEPVNGEYTFTYWFYKDANGQEKAFAFDATPVTQDTVVYAKWSANVIMTYVVYYVKKDGTPVTDPDVWVADLSEGSGLVGTTKTFYAKGGTELYSAYQNGWFPTTQSHSFVIEINEEDNVYTFEYVQMDAVPYTVRYLEAGTERVLHEAKTVIDNKKAVVTENFEIVSGYAPDAFQKRLVVTPNGENEIVFYYTKDETKAAYSVNHYTVAVDGTITLYSTTQNINKVPYTITVEPLSIENYSYNASRTMLTQNGTTTAPTSMSVLVNTSADGFTMDLYYEENKATINYNVATECNGYGSVSPVSESIGIITGKAEGSTATANVGYRFVGWYKDDDCTMPVTANWVTDTKLSPKKTADEVWVDGTTYYAKFEELNAAINYVIVDPDGNQHSADAACGTLTSYGEELPIVTGTATGSTAASTNEAYYKFEGWYSNAECTKAVDASWVTNGTIVSTKADGALWPETSTFYAKFVEQPVTITYKVVGPDGCGTVDVNDGDVTAAGIQVSETIANRVSGTALGATAAPSSNVYKFVGWYTDEACTKPVVAADGTVTDTSFVPAKEAANAEANPPVPAAYDAATFYAKFEYNLTSLTIVKDGYAETASIDPYQTFIFKVTGGDLGEGIMVSIDGDGSKTISGLTVGVEYTVTEMESWSWRYDSDSSKSITLQPSGNTVTINNTREHLYWLDGNAVSETNVYGN